LAYQLTRGEDVEGRKIVVLEAKDVASGASESVRPPCALSPSYLSYLPYLPYLLTLVSHDSSPHWVLMHPPAGRNGGHVRPASFLSYPGLIKPLDQGGAGQTPLEAVTILEDEEENMRLVREIVEREGLNSSPYAYGGVEFEMKESLVGASRYELAGGGADVG
jgi:hypothetical protein